MTKRIFDLKAMMLAVFAFLSISMAAQTSVTGVVLEPSGDPAIGATVREKGTKAGGTATDFDGKFTIKVSGSNATLVVSYVGMKTQEVQLAGRKNVTIQLESSATALDEVVVVGYGTMKKSDLAGASASMDEKALKGSIITNLDQSLQGRATGVTAVSTSGAPGSASSIRVRGQATINANAEPLYVIDGVIVQSSGASGADLGLGDALGNSPVSTVSPLSTINPSDIVSMEILKDASATAIYGAQGSNGVVLITTKRGKAGDAKFTYEGMVAAQRQTKRLDMLNLRQFAEFYNELYNGGELSLYNDYYSDPSVLGVGTNWQDAIFRTALQHQHQVSAQGGTDKVKYYVSGSYMDQDGTIIGSNFNRYSFRCNLDAQLKSWLKLGLNATYSNTDENIKHADSDEGIVNYSLQTIPDIPIYDVNGNYATVVREGYTNPNPVALAMYDDILLKRQKLTGSIFADVTPIKNVTWHTELGYDISASRGETYKPMVDLGGWKRLSNDSRIQKNSSTYWAIKNYVTYNGNIDKHSFTVMGGQECWESKWDYISVYNTALASDAVHNPALGSGTPQIGSGFGSTAMASFFARGTYNYDDRYLGTYTYRYDGSSNFGPNKRWAGFHSVALAWRFSNEKWFEAYREVISNGKLRLGWGQTGNANIGGFKWGSAISAMSTGLGLSYRPANIPNEDIKWEQQEQWNVGLDLGFFHGRLNFVADLYKKRSSDMLMPLQLPSYMGTQGNASSCLAAPWGNYGDIENKGLELELNTRPVVTKDFEWSSDFQISFNKNKLVGLAGTKNAAIIGYGQWNDVVSMSEIGKSLYNFYGYVVDGVYQDLADLQNSPKPAKYPADGVTFNRTNTVWVGDIKYKDISGPNGEPDGVIDEYDRTDIGSPMPKFTFGWTNTFTYKNFDLSVFVNGSYGNKVFNYLGMKLTHMNSAWINQVADVTDRAVLEPIDPSKVYADGAKWYDDVTNVRVANPDASLPRASVNDPNDNDRISDRYVEDGSYIRLKNVTLGYTFPSQMVKRWGLENLRVYANLQNLCTITGYKGYDPEIGASTASTNVFGLDNGRYPSPTVYSFGLSVSF